MPTHVYKPVHDPPTWRDRLLVHPMEVPVAAMLVLSGGVAGLALLVPGFTPNRSLDAMPGLTVVLVAAFLFAGGILALTGLYWRGDNVSTGWALERFGWLLASGGFATYAISVCWHFPGSLFAWGFPLGLGIACFFRFWSLVKIEEATRQVIAEVKGQMQ